MEKKITIELSYEEFIMIKAALKDQERSYAEVNMVAEAAEHQALRLDLDQRKTITRS